MKTLALSLALLVVASLTLVAVSPCQPAPPVSLKPGDMAPGLKLRASDGREYDLAQYRGTRAVAICWFPRAGSQGAKNQCAALEAAMPRIPRDKVQVFGCSTAALDVTTAFAQQGHYSFPVLSDADHNAAQAWGCLRPDGLSQRWTFLIGDQGAILAVNKSITPQTQGADLTKMLADAGLIPPGAAVSAPQLRPGSLFTVKFPDMPPTLFDLWNKQNVPASMAVFLPKNYDPQRKHPLLIFLNGGDGGQGTNPGVARALSQEQDFVCVDLPLFKKNIDPADPANRAPLMVIRDQDGKFAWPLYRTMLAKLDEMVPNIDPAHRILGGFSNGAHMTGELIDQSDGEIARRFSAFFMVEGGGRTQRYDLIKGKRLLMLYGSARALPRSQQICDSAKAAGAAATLHEMVGVGHAFPASEYPAVRQWLRGPGME